MSVRAKAEKRRAGVMGQHPCRRKESRRGWGKRTWRCENANDVGAIVSLGSVIAQGADQMRAFATRASMVSNMVIT